MSTFRSYAEEFRRALNLYSETPDELVEAAREGRLDRELSRWQIGRASCRERV